MESRGAVDPEISENLVRDMLTTATAYFSSEEILPTTLLHRIIKEAIQVTDDNYGIKAAITWAKGYEFSQALVDSLRAAGLDFTSMVRQRLKPLSKDRLNHSGVDNIKDDNCQCKIRLPTQVYMISIRRSRLLNMLVCIVYVSM